MKINKNPAKYWDKALSLVEGCEATSEGCLNCWSAAQTHIRSHQSNQKIQNRYGGLTTPDGKFNGKTRLMWDDTEKPLSVKKPTVWAVWNDLFHKKVSMNFIDGFLETVIACPQHSFLILTKRPGNIEKKLYGNSMGYSQCRILGGGDYLSNLYIGVTVESQKHVGRVDTLINAWPGLKYISVEPMLSKIKFGGTRLIDIDQVICGGESGKGARPLNLDWVRLLQDECLWHNTQFFFKQVSGYRPEKLPKLDGKRWDHLVWRK